MDVVLIVCMCRKLCSCLFSIALYWGIVISLFKNDIKERRGYDEILYCSKEDEFQVVRNRKLSKMTEAQQKAYLEEREREYKKDIQRKKNQEAMQRSARALANCARYY